MKRNKKKKMEGISRIDAERAIGWYVRIYYNSEEDIHSKFFSDTVYGSKKKALKTAKKYRKAYIRENPPPVKMPFHRKRISNNTSGINGISETYTWSKKKMRGHKVPCFSVSWTPVPNERKCRKFYFHHYGSREEAFRAAIEFRRARELKRLKRWAKERGKPIEIYLEALDQRTIDQIIEDYS